MLQWTPKVRDVEDDPESRVRIRQCPDDVPTKREQPAARAFFSSAPVLAIARAELPDLALDPRARFLLSFVDGQRNVEAILDASSMPTEEILAVLERLREKGVITLK